MKNKKIFYIIGAVLFVIALFVLFLSNDAVNAGPAMGDDLKVGLYALDGVPTGGGYASVPFVRGRDKGLYVDLYINVALDLNDDDILTEEEWIAQNMRARVYKDYRNNFVFSSEGLDLAEGDMVHGHASLTKNVLAGPNDINETVDGEFKELTASIELQDLSEVLGINVEGASEELKRGPAGVFSVSAAKANAEEGEDVNVFREPPVPDLPQGPMECSAVSAANSLISLAGDHDQLDDLPSDTRELIEELKQDMKFGVDGRPGILNSNFLAGKNAFVERHNLPITTTRKSNPSFQDIVDALESGGAVELSMRFIRSASGHASTGHTITVVGAFTQGGKQYVQVHDPATQPPGVENLEFSRDIQIGETVFEGINYPMWDGLSFVDDIFIQNWTSAKHAEEGEPSQTAGDTSRVEMLVIDGKYYPKSQFFVEDHPDLPGCDAPHWHARSGAVFGLDGKTSANVVNAADPGGCGFGKVSEVLVEFLDLTLEQSTALIGHVAF